MHERALIAHINGSSGGEKCSEYLPHLKWTTKAAMGIWDEHGFSYRGVKA